MSLRLRAALEMLCVTHRTGGVWARSLRVWDRDGPEDKMREDGVAPGLPSGWHRGAEHPRLAARGRVESPRERDAPCVRVAVPRPRAAHNHFEVYSGESAGDAGMDQARRAKSE